MAFDEFFPIMAEYPTISVNIIAANFRTEDVFELLSDMAEQDKEKLGK